MAVICYNVLYKKAIAKTLGSLQHKNAIGPYNTVGAGQSTLLL